MLKDKWEDKHDINLPAHTSCSNNMILQPLQGLSDNHHLTGSPSKINVTTLTSSGSNSQDDSFDYQFPQQSHISETRTGQSLIDSNLPQLIAFLSANYGPMKTPLEMGTPQYLKLVEILKQSSVSGEGSSVGKVPGGLKETGCYSKDVGTNNIQNGENNQEKTSSSEKVNEQLWEGSLQLSSSVTLSAVAFFKSGEKLVGNNWPEFIEVKGKVRLEAFEKYVQDLPRSRNRGLMVTSICWNDRSSNIGLNGMKEVTKGYKKSSRVGFAQLLSGIDLYICPRSDPIITILAKYGFFKGMSVLDDKPDSMIGCVVWRKNRPLNSPPGFSLKQGAEKKLSPENAESGQHDEREPLTLPPLTLPLTLPLTIASGNEREPEPEPLTLPLTESCADVDRNRGSCSSSADVDALVVKKRAFEDDDLPEFDFGVSCGKSTLVSKTVNSPKALNVIERNNCNNGLLQLPLPLQPSVKKTKLFDEDDMPEWRPPELQPPQIMTPNASNLHVYPPLPPPPPPLPPVPPPPLADTHQATFLYLPFRPPTSSQPAVTVRPPQSLPPPPPLPPLPPLPPPPPRPPSSSSSRFGSNQVSWRQPSFPPSIGRYPQF